VREGTEFAGRIAICIVIDAEGIVAEECVNRAALRSEAFGPAVIYRIWQFHRRVEVCDIEYAKSAHIGDEEGQIAMEGDVIEKGGKQGFG